MTQPALLYLENITKKFAAPAAPALDNVSLTLNQGELLGLLGPSGCGKTTLLRILAGFEHPSAGTVQLAGQIVSSAHRWVPPEKRHTGMVFQDYALFPHLTVARNIAFGLRGSAQQKQKRVAEVLALVGLSELEKRYPHQLSGGQQQRVALARALAPQPAMMLLDEPLSNLDVQVRQRLRQEVRRILKAAHTSAIFVTHDREEALAISDRVAVMRQGRIEQIGTPEELYAHPTSRFVAEFVTGANFLTATRSGERWQTELGEWLLPTASHLNGSKDSELMLRQEDIVLIPDDSSPVRIVERQFLGREYRYCLEIPSGKHLYARTTANIRLPEGISVRLVVNPQSLKVFTDS
ncbi:MAG: ABC transporter ATP-binding protein [Cyanophyceae cyanobacterium]